MAAMTDCVRSLKGSERFFYRVGWNYCCLDQKYSLKHEANSDETVELVEFNFRSVPFFPLLFTFKPMSKLNDKYVLFHHGRLP